MNENPQSQPTSSATEVQVPPGLLKTMLEKLRPEKKSKFDIKLCYLAIPEEHQKIRRNKIKKQRLGVQVRIGDQQFERRVLAATPTRMKTAENRLREVISLIDLSKPPGPEVTDVVNSAICTVIVETGIRPVAVIKMANNLLARTAQAQLDKAAAAA